MEFQLHASHSILEVVLPTEETQAGMVERECWGTSAEGRSINLVICSRPGPCLTWDPSLSVYQRDLSGLGYLLRRTHLSGRRFPQGGGAGTHRGTAMQSLPSEGRRGTLGTNKSVQAREYGEMSPTEKARVDFSTPSLSTNWQSWPQKTSPTSSRNL